MIKAHEVIFNITKIKRLLKSEDKNSGRKEKQNKTKKKRKSAQGTKVLKSCECLELYLK